MIITGTGHRPPRLGLDYTDKSRNKLRDFCEKMLDKHIGILNIDKIISGFANGWDQALAETAIDLNIPLHAVIPFKGQESKWPIKAQKHYQEMLNLAKWQTVVCNDGYANWKFIERDRFMVDLVSQAEYGLVLSLLDPKPEKSGTRTTVEYAESENIKVINCWEDWIHFGVLYNG